MNRPKIKGRWIVELIGKLILVIAILLILGLGSSFLHVSEDYLDTVLNKITAYVTAEKLETNEFEIKITIPRIRESYRSLFMRFINMFPILQIMLDFII